MREIQEKFSLFLYDTKGRDVGVEFLNYETARVPYNRMPVNFHTARNLLMRIPKDFLSDIGRKRPETLIEGKNYFFKTDGYCYFKFEASRHRTIIHHGTHV